MCPSWRARRRYLKRSSKACRPDLGAADCVSRSTVVRGFQSGQSLRASFTAILAAIGCRHCSRAPGSKKVHCVHAWSSAPHLPQRALLTSALDSSPAQRAQRMTSRHGIRFGVRGPSGCSARGRGPGARGARGVFRSLSWYPRCRYFWSDIAPSHSRAHAPLQPASVPFGSMYSTTGAQDMANTPRSISVRGIVHLGIPNQQGSGVGLARTGKLRFLHRNDPHGGRGVTKPPFQLCGCGHTAIRSA
jgi:hypothetical protein